MYSFVKLSIRTIRRWRCQRAKSATFVHERLCGDLLYVATFHLHEIPFYFQETSSSTLPLTRSHGYTMLAKFFYFFVPKHTKTSERRTNKFVKKSVHLQVSNPLESRYCVEVFQATWYCKYSLGWVSREDDPWRSVDRQRSRSLIYSVVGTRENSTSREIRRSLCHVLSSRGNLVARKTKIYALGIIYRSFLNRQFFFTSTSARVSKVVPSLLKR